MRDGEDETREEKRNDRNDNWSQNNTKIPAHYRKKKGAKLGEVDTASKEDTLNRSRLLRRKEPRGAGERRRDVVGRRGRRGQILPVLRNGYTQHVSGTPVTHGALCYASLVVCHCVKEGRKEGRKGRKEGRKEGKKERLWVLWLWCRCSSRVHAVLPGVHDCPFFAEGSLHVVSPSTARPPPSPRARRADGPTPGPTPLSVAHAGSRAACSPRCAWDTSVAQWTWCQVSTCVPARGV